MSCGVFIFLGCFDCFLILNDLNEDCSKVGQTLLLV